MGRFNKKSEKCRLLGRYFRPSVERTLRAESCEAPTGRLALLENDLEKFDTWQVGPHLTHPSQHHLSG